MQHSITKILLTTMYLSVSFENWSRGSDVEEWKYFIHERKTLDPSNSSIVSIDEMNLDLFRLAASPQEGACVDYCSQDAMCVTVAFNR